MRKLFQVKQEHKESMIAFVIRFRDALLESREEEERLLETFLGALTTQW